MPPDKFDHDDPLSFLGLKDREMLGKLAKMDLRTEVDELIWLIRARAFGHLKNLGDDAVPPPVSADEIGDYLERTTVRLEREP